MWYELEVVKTGIDLVNIADFENSLRSGGENFTKKVFNSSELRNGKTEHLAGVFAAKEAIIKALSLPAGSWLDIFISYEDNGRPVANLSKSFEENLKSFDLSISHSDDYAIALFVALA